MYTRLFECITNKASTSKPPGNTLHVSTITLLLVSILLNTRQLTTSLGAIYIIYHKLLMNYGLCYYQLASVYTWRALACAATHNNVAQKMLWFEWCRRYEVYKVKIFGLEVLLYRLLWWRGYIRKNLRTSAIWWELSHVVMILFADQNWSNLWNKKESQTYIFWELHYRLRAVIFRDQKHGSVRQ